MNLLRAIGTVFSLLLLLVFAAMTAVSLWGYTVSQTLLSDGFTSRIINDSATYNGTIVPILNTTVSRSFQDAPVGSAEWYTAQALISGDEAAQRRLAERLMPQTWFATEFSRNTQTTLTWYEQNAMTPDLYFDMTMVQQQLSGEQGQQLAASLLDALPACSAAQEETIAAITSGSAPATVSLPPCSSSTLTEAQLSTAFNEATASMSATFPSEAARTDSPTEQENALFLNAKAVLRSLDRLSIYVFVFPMVALLAIWFLSVRSARDFFRWAGAAFTLGGAAALTLPLAVMFLPPTRFLLTPSLSDALLQGAYLLLVTLTGLTATLLTQGGVLAGAGLAFIVISFVIRKK